MFLLSSYVSFPHGAVGWSVICDWHILVILTCFMFLGKTLYPLPISYGLTPELSDMTEKLLTAQDVKQKTNKIS